MSETNHVGIFNTDDPSLGFSTTIFRRLFHYVAASVSINAGFFSFKKTCQNSFLYIDYIVL